MMLINDNNETCSRDVCDGKLQSLDPTHGHIIVRGL